MEKVLLFQVQDEEAGALANLLAAMKVKCERIPAQAFRQTIGELASEKRNWNLPDLQNTAAEYHGEAPGGSLLLFCDVTEKHFNKILALLRARAVRIDYKAVLTQTNREWNVLRLYAELAREKAEYERMRGL